ncbi:hypothetical protein, partial [Halocynthiibacter sp.]|uniref:hypothetical protein n=1 Tax=Halocynthiibacter sp. TaxID=1979210 RepID=UPI003C539481
SLSGEGILVSERHRVLQETQIVANPESVDMAVKLRSISLQQKGGGIQPIGTVYLKDHQSCLRTVLVSSLKAYGGQSNVTLGVLYRMHLNGLVSCSSLLGASDFDWY